MKPNQVFLKNIKNGIITKEMLALAIYSVNKRAKNARDKAEEYHQEGICCREWGIYNPYAFLNASQAKSNKIKYYDMKKKLLSIVEPNYIHRVEVCDSVKWFFVYEVSGYCFHSPIDEETALNSELKIVKIEDFETTGKEIIGLMSVQFVRKIIELIKSGNYTLVE